MKLLLILVFLVTASLGAGSDIKDSIDTLIDALCVVESNNKADAIGDGGLAVGILQIHPIMIKDANRILRKEVYTLGDRKDPVKSRKICRVFLLHYCKGRSLEYMARCWNGGPKGYRKKATLKYWAKVQSKLKGK